MREILGIKERKLHNMRWNTIKYYAAVCLSGFLAGIVVVILLLLYCRMAGPLL